MEDLLEEFVKGYEPNNAEIEAILAQKPSYQEEHYLIILEKRFLEDPVRVYAQPRDMD
ncbi:MAG: hypothetical protein ABH824_00185 [Nanoarchaeota archaeon]|nr:hypothetical protein [Nanoarchaeota archaeon]